LIDHIPAHAFDFKNPSNITLALNLGSNNLNGSSFEKGVFLNAKRPINLDLSWNKINYLDETIFLSFLSLNSDNRIQLFGNLLSCSDCRSYWLIRDKDKLKNKFIGDVQCKDNNSGDVKSLWDGNDFAECHSI
jgi:hypothetical protein